MLTPGQDAGEPLIRVTGVTQSYTPGVRILSGVDLEVRAGEILALVGENGAGKSTLMKIIAGLLPHGSFEGSLRVRGAETALGNVQDAEREGIVLVPQELRVAPGLSIAENMFIGNLPRTRLGLVDFDALDAQARRWLELFEMDIDPSVAAGTLSMSEQRMVMMAGALSKRASMLLLDEPTAALTDGETKQLFRHVLKLKAEGLGIVLITHRLDEVEQVADRVAVLRSGRLVERFDEAKGRRRDIVRAMVGNELAKAAQEVRTPRTPGREVLSVRSMRVEDPEVVGKLRVDGVDLDLREGEIHGLYGLVGAGRTELARALFGDWRGRIGGEFVVLDEPTLPASPREALKRGLAMLTEDRKASGILDGHCLSTNFSAASLGTVNRWGVIRHDAEHDRNEALLGVLDIRPARLDPTIESLSGGNQQKVLIGRWLNTGPRILILDEPSLGVDVGARVNIYRAIADLAEGGMAILLISSDVDEILAECDRSTVMYKGRKVAEFDKTHSREDLVGAATGG